MIDLFDFGDEPQLYRDNTPDELAALLDQYLTTNTNSPNIQYDVYNSTVGSEYELADIPRSEKLPLGLSWDGKDETVMNSNGVATDPSLNASKRTWDFGGELNTAPQNSVDDIVELYKSLLTKFPEITVNNSCNLHNHFRVPNLDLDGLKRVIAYYYVFRTEMINISDFIPNPNTVGFTEFNGYSKDDLKLVQDRYTHHTRAHKGTRHSDLPVYTVQFKLEATCLEDFHAASVRTPSGTDVLDSNAVRAAVNTWQMRLSRKKEHSHLLYDDRPFAESGTIEFRSHHGTVDLEKYRNTLIWDQAILNAALNTGETPTQVYAKLFQDRSLSDVFPEYINMDPKLYRIFKQTKNNGSDKRRTEVTMIISTLQAEGKL